MGLQDRETVDRLTKKERLDREKELQDVRVVLNTENGQRFIWKLLELSEIYNADLCMNDRQLAFMQGKRTMGLKIIDDVTDACPDIFLKMMKERREKEGLKHDNRKPTELGGKPLGADDSDDADNAED